MVGTNQELLAWVLVFCASCMASWTPPSALCPALSFLFAPEDDHLKVALDYHDIVWI